MASQRRACIRAASAKARTDHSRPSTVATGRVAILRLFAEAMRTPGFEARLVSGYLYASNDIRRGSAGSGSTYTWFEVFVPGAGWVPFDPTNRSVGSAN